MGLMLKCDGCGKIGDIVNLSMYQTAKDGEQWSYSQGNEMSEIPGDIPLSDIVALEEISGASVRCPDCARLQSEYDDAENDVEEAVTNLSSAESELEEAQKEFDRTADVLAEAQSKLNAVTN